MNKYLLLWIFSTISLHVFSCDVKVEKNEIMGKVSYLVKLYDKRSTFSFTISDSKYNQLQIGYFSDPVQIPKSGTIAKVVPYIHPKNKYKVFFPYEMKKVYGRIRNLRDFTKSDELVSGSITFKKIETKILAGADTDNPVIRITNFEIKLDIKNKAGKQFIASSKCSSL